MCNYLLRLIIYLMTTMGELIFIRSNLLIYNLSLLLLMVVIYITLIISSNKSNYSLIKLINFSVKDLINSLTIKPFSNWKNSGRIHTTMFIPPALVVVTLNTN